MSFEYPAFSRSPRRTCKRRPTCSQQQSVSQSLATWSLSTRAATIESVVPFSFSPPLEIAEKSEEERRRLWGLLPLPWAAWRRKPLWQIPTLMTALTRKSSLGFHRSSWNCYQGNSVRSRMTACERLSFIRNCDTAGLRLVKVEFDLVLPLPARLGRIGRSPVCPYSVQHIGIPIIKSQTCFGDPFRNGKTEQYISCIVKNGVSVSRLKVFCIIRLILQIKEFFKASA